MPRQEVRLFEDLIDAKYTEILLVGRKTLAKDANKTDFKAEAERLEALEESMEKLKKESPGEFLIGSSLINRYNQRLKEQSQID